MSAQTHSVDTHVNARVCVCVCRWMRACFHPKYILRWILCPLSATIVLFSSRKACVKYNVVYFHIIRSATPESSFHACRCVMMEVNGYHWSYEKYIHVQSIENKVYLLYVRVRIHTFGITHWLAYKIFYRHFKIFIIKNELWSIWTQFFFYDDHISC